MIAFIKRVFRFAVSEKQLSDNPVDEDKSIKIPVFAKEDKDIRPLASCDAKRILEVMEGAPRLKPIVYCMLFAGMRIGEVLALTWDKIDFENGRIIVNKAVKNYTLKEGGRTKYEYRIGPPKTKSSIRIIPLSENLRECLVKWQTIQDCVAKDKTDMGLVFPKRRGGLQDYDSFNIGFNKYLAKLGIDYHIYHSRVFRHTFASYAVKKGVEVKALQELMGHANIETTYQYYIDADFDSQTQAITDIDSALADLDNSFIFFNIGQVPIPA
jgi:integrase